ncbi:MAG: ATP-binding cassette domain-containing protein, partial [Candidatus Dadabacteria bacterium]
MIRFERVSVGFGATQALTDVSFELAPESITFLTGHSGAGKSTLLKVLLSLIAPSRGRVCVN